MIELKGIEAERAEGLKPDPRSQFIILPDQKADLGPGDELLLMISKPPHLGQEDYGIPLRLTDRTEPDEDEVVVQYGDRVFVAQKLPEFI
jgi:hypothetical protein